MNDREIPLPPIEIPFSSLSKSALHGLIESFVSREGTDYGAEEVSFDEKTLQVEAQIRKGEVVIVFDPNTESVTLLTRAEFKKRLIVLPGSLR